MCPFCKGPWKNISSLQWKARQQERQQSALDRHNEQVRGGSGVGEWAPAVPLRIKNITGGPVGKVDAKPHVRRRRASSHALLARPAQPRHEAVGRFAGSDHPANDKLPPPSHSSVFNSRRVAPLSFATQHTTMPHLGLRVNPFTASLINQTSTGFQVRRRQSRKGSLK